MRMNTPSTKAGSSPAADSTSVFTISSSTFTEEHISYSTALHSTLEGQGAYLVGPLARYNLNFDRLSPLAQEAALGAGLQPVCRNPFQSIVVRSIEILQACDEALRLIDQYELPESPVMEIGLKAGTGYGCTEAPRGILYHRYRFDEHGTILDAKIIPPTSQNQKTIEDDLKQFVSRNVALPEEELRGRCEQVVRNYRSVHFLFHAFPEVADRPHITREYAVPEFEPQVLVIGIGNPCRGDDSVGRIVVRRIKRRNPPFLRAIEHDGEGTSLMELWRGAVTSSLWMRYLRAV